MKKIAVLILMLAAVPAAAYEITADSVIAAHRMGAPTDQILRQMADPTNTMVQPTAADAERMQAAGVPPSVMGALASSPSRSASVPPPANSVVVPDNPRLAEVVRLVDSGLSEQLIVEQITQQGVMYRPTINDLIYLKENNVSEGIIGALMTAELLARDPAATATAGKANGLVIDGLVLKGGMMSFGGTRTGQLTLSSTPLEWRKDSKDCRSKAMPDLSVIPDQQSITACLQSPLGPSTSQRPEVEFDLAQGSNFTFEDAETEVRRQQRDRPAPRRLISIASTPIRP